MTPLGCPDCLLIRYEPRALRARISRARARAIAFAFPSQACVARFFVITCFLGLLLFFRMRNVCESRAFVVSRVSNRRCPAMKSLMMLRFRLNIAVSFLRPFVIPRATEQSQLSINSVFRDEF